MQSNPGEAQSQELTPCPCCSRKFLSHRLEVHLRSCDKSNKFHSGQGRGGYDNNAFLDKLDKEMAKEQEHSGYKSSKKPKEDPQKAFLEKLDKELEKESQSSTYKQSQPKKKEVVDLNQDFMEKLDKEWENEQKNPKYKPSENKGKVKQAGGDGAQVAPKDSKQAFLEKLEKEMEKDAQNPYVPYAEQKKKLQGEIKEEDPNKVFLEKLDKELQNEDKYKPTDRTKKAPVNKDASNKKAFIDKLDSELEKEKDPKPAQPKASTAKWICYFCFKSFPIPSYASHLKTCEISWRRNNIGKDPNVLKPEDFDQIIGKLSVLTAEQIEKYNKNLEDNKDNMVYVPCDYCARNIWKLKMEEHLKTCSDPMAPPPKKQLNRSQFHKVVKHQLKKKKKKNPEIKIQIIVYLKWVKVVLGEAKWRKRNKIHRPMLNELHAINAGGNFYPID